MFSFDLGIKTTIDNTTFRVLNIVFGQISKPIPKHSHGNNSFEVHYIPYGHGKAFIEGEEYEVVPNTLYITGPHIEHEQIPDDENPMSEYCVYFNIQKSGVNKKTEDNLVTKFVNTPFWYGQDLQDIYPLMQQIIYELENKYKGYMLAVESHIRQCLVRIVRNYEMGQKSETQFLHSNLSDTKYFIVETSILSEYNTITLELLAKRVGLSTRQTERFLKNHFGKTFLQKKNDAKMSEAKKLLSDTELSIAKIAEKLHYSSTQHFCYAFKKYCGISAGKYRKTSINI